MGNLHGVQSGKHREFFNSAEFTWKVCLVLCSSSHTEDFQPSTCEHTQKHSIANLPLFWSKTENTAGVKGLTEQFGVDLQKGRVHAVHLTFPLTTWAMQTACMSNPTQMLSKNFFSHWQLKVTKPFPSKNTYLSLKAQCIFMSWINAFISWRITRISHN